MKHLLTLILLAGAAVLLLIMLRVDGRKVRSTPDQDKRFAQAFARLEHARAACEDQISAMDRAQASADLETHSMFCSSPRGGCSANVLQVELKQQAQQHTLLLRECTLKQLGGTLDTSVSDVWLKGGR